MMTTVYYVSMDGRSQTKQTNIHIYNTAPHGYEKDNGIKSCNSTFTELTILSIPCTYIHNNIRRRKRSVE